MKCLPAFALALACSGPICAADATVTIRPVQVVSLAEVPAGAPQDAKTVKFTKGFSVGYLIEGEDIIGIDKKSLVIEHILLPGGKDITKKRNGKDNFELGAFPEVSDDGRFGFFAVESDEHVFGKADGLDIKGTIGVRLASDLKTAESKPHPLGANDTEPVDGFTVTFGPGPNADKVPDFVKQSYKDKVPLRVAGPLEKVAEVRLIVAGKEVEPNEWSSADTGSRTYFFPKGDGASAGALRIKYWQKLKVVVVPFHNP
jgi:hypothetical protein